MTLTAAAIINKRAREGYLQRALAAELARMRIGNATPYILGHKKLLHTCFVLSFIVHIEC
jgi:hypothetical protein